MPRFKRKSRKDKRKVYLIFLSVLCGLPLLIILLQLFTIPLQILAFIGEGIKSIFEGGNGAVVLFIIFLVFLIVLKWIFSLLT